MDTEAVPTNGEVLTVHSTASNTIAANYSVDLTLPTQLVNISTTANLYLVANVEFTSGAFSGFGSIQAVRIA